MSKVFRPWKIEEVWLLPPSVAEFLPAGHPAHLVRDLVCEELDLSAIMSCYTEVKGHPPYHPGMMVALLLYAYSQGVYSSRRIARGCEERLDFQAVTALNRPDFHSISEFRRRHLEALGGLFVQVLTLCRRAGLAGLGHVAVDGTKIKANASKHKAMRYGRMALAEATLAKEVDEWLARAQAEDAADDAEHGSARRGDEPPAWMRASKPGGGTKGGPLVQATRTRLKRGGHQSRYRLRKFTVEPVFGHIKQARGFRQFLLRGINKVKAEGAMICTAHNLAKLTAWADAP